MAVPDIGFPNILLARNGLIHRLLRIYPVITVASQRGSLTASFGSIATAMVWAALVSLLLPK